MNNVNASGGGGIRQRNAMISDSRDEDKVLSQLTKWQVG